MKEDAAFEKEKKRKLSAAEEERMARFEALCAEMAEKGYQKRDLTVGIVKANVITLLLAIPICAAVILLFRLVQPEARIFLTGRELILWLLLFFALTAVHEGIHGLTWSRFTPNGFRDIDFGFMKEYLTPYCTCCAPLSRGAYVAGSLMPLIVLGLIPAVVAVFSGSALLLSLALVMILAAGGDVLIVLTLLRHGAKAGEQLIYDHPTRAGCVVFEK